MNRLASESSLYLQSHKDNPVDWYPWGPEAFAKAEAENKPILLSIGYTACHWCHVMDQESFREPATAAQMNEHYVCVMVDREEHPDLDQIYQAAANTMGHHGGWPLTVILTPKGVPFFAGAYFPKEERFNTPPFTKILNDVARVYKDEAAQIDQTTATLLQQLNNLWHRDMRGPLDAGLLDSGQVRIAQRFDLFFGGVLGTMKFPSVSLLEVLWRAYLRTGQPQFMQLVSTTMDAMLLGGLCDHVGGGFFRYCADERWLVPRFEKMLNDNAMLLEMMTAMWQFNRNGLCQARIEETVNFLLRDMRNGDGFAASLDGDSEGEEGKYYLWTEPEIDAALMGTFVAKFKSVYGVTREGNHDDKNILRRLFTPAPYPQTEADEALLAKQRELLLKARYERPAPARNDMVLADWNGLAITALANAGATFNRTDWTTAAIKAFDFVVKTMGDGDRLHHSWIAGKRGPRGFADDYAQMARAALALYEVAGDKRYLDHAKTWTRVLNEHFWDSQQGGYFFTADDDEPLIVRVRMVFDQPTPSANGTMLQVLMRLFMATGDKDYQPRINTILNAFSGEATRAFISMASYFNGLEFALSELHLVVIGPLNHPKTHELTAAIMGRALPNRFLTVIAPEDGFPEGHPVHGKTMQNGQPTAYVCQRGSCSPPVTSAVTLSQMLQLPPQRPQPGTRPQ